MKTNREYTPTPQELNDTFRAMTIEQKLQFEAILNMMTALLINVYHASKLEMNFKKEKNL